jgi:MIP family channel proteins
MSASAWRWNAIVAEVFGTFLFFFIGMGSVASAGVDRTMVAFAHGLALAVMVSALGAVSGGHFNPAVTMALWLASRMTGRRALAYILAQLIGALAAAALIGYVFNTPDAVKENVPALGQGVDVFRGSILEAVATAGLLVAVFGTAVDPRAPRTIGGLGIGFAVAAGILAIGPVTGGALNPARWFGPAVVSGTISTDSIVWIAGPLVGAAVVAVIWRLLFLPEADAQTGADV